jgi:flagellar hook-basal body complex protein FliE
MTDPLGLIGGVGGAGGARGLPQRAVERPRGEAPDFAGLLRKNLDQVNSLQQDATRAVEDLMTGERDDVEGVILATQKADTAFRMLQAMRNKVMEAYEEVKQVRV